MKEGEEIAVGTSDESTIPAPARLTAAQMARMNRLLDEALDLDEAGRRDWLAALGPEHHDIAAALRKALAVEGSGSGQALFTLPKIGSDEEACPNTDSGLEPGARVGPYELIRPLGAGGMAEVWLARRADGAFKRDVALKLPLVTRMRRDLEARFTREREILAALSHPNIARLYDAGFAQDGQPYLALEYVVGTPLTVYCDDQRLTVRARLELFGQILSAVEYAHAHLVIHRDIKPSNILVTGEGRVQLLDFGIAKLLIEGEAKETEITQLWGRAMTPDYASPEQIAGAPITTAADVYALGVMLYELLTGERPYRLKRDTRAALEEAILQVESRAPSRVCLNEAAARARGATVKSLARALKGDLDVIILKALKKSPAERYPTANAFSEDIERHLANEVVLARPDGLAYRAVRFARRHWAAMAVASALLLTLVLGLAVTTYEAKLAAEQRDAAVEAQLHSLTQTAAARLASGDTIGALGILLEVLPHPSVQQSFLSQAISTFQEWRAVDAQVIMLAGHSDMVRSVGFSPDGQRILTASVDGTARIWELPTGHEQLVLRGHGSGVSAAAFSPDGRRVVTGSFDKTARIWDATTGRQVLLLSGHTDRVRWAVFSPDGKRVATASFDRTARIWDAATGQVLSVLSGHTDKVTCAAFSPDGARVTTASEDKTVRIWDAATGRQLQILNGHTDRVWVAEFSPDGNSILSASNDKTVRIWNVKTGREDRVLGHPDVVAVAAFSPDGQRVVSGSVDGIARIWDVGTASEIRQLRGHTGMVESVVFSPDGRQILTGSFDNTIRLWDVAPGAIMQLRGHTYNVQYAEFSPDGTKVVTASVDNTARVWDAATGDELVRLAGHADAVQFAAFSPDGRRVVTASHDHTARVWDAATGEGLSVLRGHTDRVRCAAFSPDSARVVTASEDRTIRIWDAASGREIMLMSSGKLLANSAQYSADGKRIVSAGEDGSARIWDALTGRQIGTLTGHSDSLTFAAFSPDGQHVLAASMDKIVRIWDVSSGRQRSILEAKGPLRYAAYSRDGTRVVGSGAGTVYIWDAMSGRETMRIITFGQTIGTAAFAPDGRRIVTSSTDTHPAIWDVRTESLDVQVRWAAAAQFNTMSNTERSELGLSAAVGPRRWPDDRSRCDELAAAPYDPDRRAPGVVLEDIAANLALAACSSRDGTKDEDGRLAYQQGRALMASGDLSEAARDFEQAVAKGYRAARIDLARLVSQPSRMPYDVPRALSLYTRAWDEGVFIAGFELAKLYEHGVAGEGDRAYLAADASRAGGWYRKAADAGEPNALAHLAEEESSASQLLKTETNAHLLEAFRYYTAAAERARVEDWPDDSWKQWRYYRASLARVLARMGMMREVADTYDAQRQEAQAGVPRTGVPRIAPAPLYQGKQPRGVGLQGGKGIG